MESVDDHRDGRTAAGAGEYGTGAAAQRTVITANRKEDGCLLFAFGEDVLEPGLIRIVERWRDWEALEAHDRAPHVVTWRAALKEIGIISRDLTAHDGTNGRPI